MAWIRCCGGSAIEPTPTALVPKMTANNAPYGIAFASSEYGANYQAWKAFNQSTTDTPWESTLADRNSWVGYQFVVPTVVKSCEYTINCDRPCTIVVQGSNDNTIWEDVSTVYSVPGTGVVSGILSMATNKKRYGSYRLLFNSTGTAVIPNAVREMQFYGYQ